MFYNYRYAHMAIGHSQLHTHPQFSHTLTIQTDFLMRTEATWLLGTKEKNFANQVVLSWCMKACLEFHLDSFL